MQQTYTTEQLTYIRDQALIYQCACPAQVCVAIDTILKMHALQMQCLNATDTDRSVHERISATAEKCLAELELCLTEILQLEGWNMQTLKMPEYLKKRLLDE